MRFWICIALLAMAAGTGLAANVDWQGGSTSLNTPTSWFLITGTNPGGYTTNPPTTRLPANGDYAYVRNGTTVTVDSTITCPRFYIGGPAMPTPPGTATKVLVGPGGSLLIDRPTLVPDPAFGNSAEIMVGSPYTASIIQTGGIVKCIGTFGGTLSLGRESGNGYYNLSGGSLHVESRGGDAVSMLDVGYYGGTGVFDQSGGRFTMTCGGGRTIPSVGAGPGGVGTYNMSGGTFASLGLAGPVSGETGKFRVGRNGGRGVFNQTGGLVEASWLGIAYNDMDTDYQECWGTYNMTGGTLRAGYKFTVGRDWDPDGEAGPLPFYLSGHGRFNVTQSCAVECQSSFQLYGTQAGTLGLTIDSASNFNMTFGDWMTVDGGNIDVTLSGYTPTHDQAWKVMTATPTLVGGPVTIDCSPVTITPDFSAEIRNTYEIWLVYTGGAAQPHPGDANNDGAVNVGDLGILAANWNGTGKAWATGDFTGEGDVNVGDLGVLAANWGWTGAPAGPVPEPASLVLLGLGGLAMLRRRR